VVTPDTDWFLDPQHIVKPHILEWPFVASLRHTCAIIILFNQHLDMLYLRKNWPFVYIEKVLDL